MEEEKVVCTSCDGDGNHFDKNNVATGNCQRCHGTGEIKRGSDSGERPRREDPFPRDRNKPSTTEPINDDEMGPEPEW